MTISSVDGAYSYAELNLNKVMKIFDAVSGGGFSDFKARTTYFSRELSCHLFFGKSIEELSDIIKDETELNELLDDISSFVVKIGSLYVTVTDFDKDGVPLLDLTKVRFKMENGKYHLVLEDVIDDGDVHAIVDPAKDLIAAVKKKDAGEAIRIVVESLFGVAQYSMTIYEEFKDFDIEKIFSDIFDSLQLYPEVVSKHLQFRSVQAMTAGLIFSGVMLFVWVGVSQIPDSSVRTIVSGLLSDRFVRGQLDRVIKLITEVMTGTAKISNCCIPSPCCGNIAEINENLQKDLDTLIAGTEHRRPPTESKASDPEPTDTKEPESKTDE